ncbi:MAG: M28 family peptidase [Anaerolineae bacterium]|nr:M28 family peptidase [Anaerolineae bacterium]
MRNRSQLILSLIIFDIVVLAGLGIWYFVIPQTQPVAFDAQHAYRDAEYQLSLGARTPGSEAHAKLRAWIKSELEQAGWSVSEQKSERMGHPIYNITASRGTGSPLILLGAHYDTRLKADNDPDAGLQNQPVPGANDGASGVSVLLELARSLPKDLNKEVWLVFFDAEDQGNFQGWDWILGSRVYAETLPKTPQAVVIVDMIGDSDLNIYYEKNSNPAVMQEIWKYAANAGFNKQFIPTYRFSMEDDHTPFLEKGIPAVDMIDFDYPYWHTTHDTIDKISAESLNAVGLTLYQWLINTQGNWQN